MGAAGWQVIVYRCPACWQYFDPQGRVIPKHFDNASNDCPASGYPLRIAMQRVLTLSESDDRLLASELALAKHPDFR